MCPKINMLRTKFWHGNFMIKNIPLGSEETTTHFQNHSKQTDAISLLCFTAIPFQTLIFVFRHNFNVYQLFFYFNN